MKAEGVERKLELEMEILGEKSWGEWRRLNLCRG